MTPLQRPPKFADKLFFTSDEADAWIKGARDRAIANQGKLNIDTTGEEPEVWGEPQPLVPDLRTSLIVDPPSGRIPIRPEVQKRNAALAEERDRTSLAPDGPEDLFLSDRCLLWPAVGPPMRPLPYNAHIQIVQTRDYVAIESEMIHDVRVIPTNGRPHLAPTIRRWQGDSVGRWDGDTFVVDTTNFTAKSPLFGSGEALHVVERFTVVDGNTLLYRYTVDDPATFTQAWTVEWPLRRAAGPIYEYSCHEANYSIEGILRGARAQQQ